MRLLPAFVCASLLFLSCGDTSDSSTNTGVPNATAVGTPSGSTATLSVGPAGGSLASPDGRLAIQVPVDAFTDTTTLTIQPITNEIIGVGAAYRISTSGLLPTAAFTLTFAYHDSELVGSGSTSLLAVVQQSDRTWRVIAGHAVDTAARTLTVELNLTRSSAAKALDGTGTQADAGMMLGRYLEPSSGTVNTRGQLQFRMMSCVTPTADDPSGQLAPLTGECPCQPLSATSGVTWLVDGVSGGNATKGTIAGQASTATYTAPAQVPTPSHVIVQSRMIIYDYMSGATELLSAPVEISGHDYSGDFQFSGMGGPDGGTIGYMGYGSIGVDLSCDGGTACNLYEGTGSVTIESFSNGAGTTCTFAPSTHTGTVRIIIDPIASTYTWQFLTINWTATASCNGSAPQPNYPLSFVFAGNPMCGLEWPFTTQSQLTGTFSCATTGTFHWDFRGR